MPAGPRRPRSRRGVLALVVCLLLVAAGGAVAGLVATDRLPGVGARAGSTPTPTPTPSTPPRAAAGPVLSAAPAPSTEALPVRRLRTLLAAPALGRGASALVVDATSGRTLLDRGSTVAHIPASVAKLATTAAALVALGPDARFATRTVDGSRPGEVVLVGGGDPTLALRPAASGAYPRRASLTALADATAAALRRRTPGAAATRVTVRVDDSRFAGPAVSPAWPAGYVPSGVVSPVSALSVDQGRVRAGSDAREPDPALAAGRDLVRLLRRRGLTVRASVTRTVAPAAAEPLAAVSSPTVAQIVESDLQTSDNDLAEGLLRQVAIARHQPATFAGGTAAVLGVLAELGVPTGGVVLRDGSGLSRASRLPPATLAGILTAAVGDAAHPALRTLVTSLPVAGFSGTLTARYADPTTRPAAGLVRAKTGTLTGVSSLAGLAATGGRTLVFVVMSDTVPASGTLAARGVLDRVAATIAGAATVATGAGRTSP